MLKVKVYNLEGKEVEELKLDSAIFDVEINPALVHQVFESQRANARIKLAHTKTRSEVRGGGRKPWRQKGTGRARHGSIRSPIWKGGGVTFGPRTEREFGKKINKKMKRKALFMVLTDKVRENYLVILEKLELAKIKTKEMVKFLHKLPIKKGSKILLGLAHKDEIIAKSVRNLPRVKSILTDSLNIIDILNHDYLILDKEGIKKIIKVYKK
jgi:large subunit ribosomal protein L4